MISLRDDTWGKAGVRLVRLVRDCDWFDLQDLDVTTELRGDSEDAYRLGSNAKILSTDAQRNAVYGLAAEQPPDAPEAFALRLSRWFLESQGPVDQAAVMIRQRRWRRVALADGPAPHSFRGGDPDLRTAGATVSAAGAEVRAGIIGLDLLNATGSEFLGFPRDRFTSGQGAADRILATKLDADWAYSSEDIDFDGAHDAVRGLLITTFATTYSKSIQLSMQTMADAVLEADPQITTLTLQLPNLHHNLVDLSSFGIDNDRAVFVTAPAPYSVIRATFAR